MDTSAEKLWGEVLSEYNKGRDISKYHKERRQNDRKAIWALGCLILSAVVWFARDIILSFNAISGWLNTSLVGIIKYNHLFIGGSLSLFVIGILLLVIFCHKNKKYAKEQKSVDKSIYKDWTDAFTGVSKKHDKELYGSKELLYLKIRLYYDPIKKKQRMIKIVTILLVMIVPALELLRKVVDYINDKGTGVDILSVCIFLGIPFIGAVITTYLQGEAEGKFMDLVSEDFDYNAMKRSVSKRMYEKIAQDYKKISKNEQDEINNQLNSPAK